MLTDYLMTLRQRASDRVAIFRNDQDEVFALLDCGRVGAAVAAQR